MKIVGHVNNVVDNPGDLLKGVGPQIPVRRRRRNGDGLAGQQVLQDNKGCQVVITIVLTAGRDTRNVGGARVLLVNVDTVKVVVLNEAGNALGHPHPVSGSDTLAEDIVSAGVCRERPTTERQNPSRAANAFEVFKLIRRQDITDFDLVILREGAESEVQVSVLGAVNLKNVLEQTVLQG